MYYKEPELNKKGQPLCEICKVGYDRLLRHVSHRHGMNAAEYKNKFGYNPRKGITSKKLALKARENALKNFNSVIMPNLIIGGIKTRFKDGNIATNKELVSINGRETMNAYWEGRRELQEEVIATLIKKLSSGIRNIHPSS
ncbi:MucR family transcriptional regulator [Zobellia barbeyronii]|uniref:MucR family transcriptional regulator n=1 Tax=Zobellia barbeyronii TaxID=2748009 RepID=A0ABS5WKK0_9FLAO|nr:MucR family transcriptional regulator [Zobellia barbeyronii]MBT2163513.1 MucR family transcriptional regulator [Zobellia barbeyronii]